jgi:hypothetical protein
MPVSSFSIELRIFARYRFHHFLPNCASLRNAGFIIFYRTAHLCEMPVTCSSAGASQQHKPAEASKFTNFSDFHFANKPCISESPQIYKGRLFRVVNNIMGIQRTCLKKQHLKKKNQPIFCEIISPGVFQIVTVRL